MEPIFRILTATIDGRVSKTFYLELEGQIVGKADVNEWDGEGAWVFKVWVEDAYRNNGYGTKLMLGMIDHAAIEDKSGIGLGVHKDNHKARAFYERLGFVACYESDPHTIMTYHIKTTAAGSAESKSC